MFRTAFTMLELIFVIIVIGIISVLAMPSFNRNPLAEAAEQVANHIRYTQHLAMIDDVYNDKNSTWWKDRWSIRFYENTNTYYYTVFSDRDQQRNANTGVNSDEVAIDPLTQKKLHAANSNTLMNLTKSYGITNIISSCYVDDNTLVTANRGAIIFDNLGRPYNGLADSTAPTQYLLTQVCDINLSSSDGVATIRIQPETGYVSVNY